MSIFIILNNLKKNADNDNKEGEDNHSESSDRSLRLWTFLKSHIALIHSFPHSSTGTRFHKLVIKPEKHYKKGETTVIKINITHKSCHLYRSVDDRESGPVAVHESPTLGVDKEILTPNLYNQALHERLLTSLVSTFVLCCSSLAEDMKRLLSSALIHLTSQSKYNGCSSMYAVIDIVCWTFFVNDEERLMGQAIRESKVATRPERRDSSESCTICLEKFLDEVNVAQMPCCHPFHFPCIKTWLMQKNSCPLCRTSLDDNQLGYLPSSS